VTASPGSIEELRLRVSGMTCAGCAASVQRAIESQPGVRSASVSVAGGMATVVGEDLRPERLVHVIRERGFDAEPVVRREAPSRLRSEIELHQIAHERQWRRRALTGLGIWAPLELLHLLAPPAPWLHWVMLAGATAVLATAGAGFYRSAWSAALRRTTNMDTLIAIGATTAFLFSLVVFGLNLRGLALDQPLYFTESAALLGIISLGHWLEARSTARAGSAVRDLLELQPDEAELAGDSGHPAGRKPSADVVPGDRILIRPGARVPVDGEVVEGRSSVDESLVSGESEPIAKIVGSAVVAGSVNLTGRMVIEATVDGHNTTVARIAELVQRAQASKADIQRLADRVCAIFVPAVLLVAALTMAGWWIAGEPVPGVIATATVLIISCPCALGLATPMAVMVGTGAASRRGILVKSAVALEAAGRATHVVFDKTGTLTRGRPTVTALHSEDGTIGEREMLALAASVERPSEHPIARAIVEEAVRRALAPLPVEGFEARPGEGVRGSVDGRMVEVVRDEATTCQVRVDGRRIGTLTVADDPWPDAARAIGELRRMGLAVTMLSGDRQAIAERIGAGLGLRGSEIRAEATPQSKSEFIEELSHRSARGVVMVGDGINDAAALSQADLGIAMASGTNIAIESAEVVIPSHQVTAVPQTIDIARRTLRTIRQNLFFAFLYNVCMIPAAGLGLLGVHGPILAALAMAGSDLTVIGNALWLRRGLACSARRRGDVHDHAHEQPH
jgi:Cu+-exporting ATPase